MSKTVLIALAVGCFVIAMLALANVLTIWFLAPGIILVLWLARDLYEQSAAKRRLRQYENRFSGN